MVVNEKVIQSLQKKRLGIDHFLILYSLEHELEWYKSLGHTSTTLFQGLIRRGLIDSTNAITDMGATLLNLQGESPKENQESDFDVFWKAFPASDKWAHWPRTRVLRNNKRKTKSKYLSILKEGYTAEQLLKAVEADIKMKKGASFKENQLRYMQAVTTWLNQRIFEGFISTEEKEVETKKSGDNVTYGEEFE